MEFYVKDQHKAAHNCNAEQSTPSTPNLLSLQTKKKGQVERAKELKNGQKHKNVIMISSLLRSASLVLLLYRYLLDYHLGLLQLYV